MTYLDTISTIFTYCYLPVAIFTENEQRNNTAKFLQHFPRLQIFSTYKHALKAIFCERRVSETKMRLDMPDNNVARCTVYMLNRSLYPDPPYANTSRHASCTPRIGLPIRGRRAFVAIRKFAFVLLMKQRQSVHVFFGPVMRTKIIHGFSSRVMQTRFCAAIKIFVLQ
jgi:hypothetical protein